MARRLLITRRRVPPDHTEAYDQGWRELRETAVRIPCHAWRYESTSSSGSFIEFLEYDGATDPRSHPAVSRALHALDEIARGTIEEWRDASNPEVPSDRS